MNPLVAGLLWLARGAAWLGLGILILVALVLILLLLALLLPFRFSGRFSRSLPMGGEQDGGRQTGTDAGPASATTDWQVHLRWGGPLLAVDAGSGQSRTGIRLLGRRMAQGVRRGRGGSDRPRRTRRRKAVGIPLRRWLNREALREALLLLKRIWSSLHLRARGDLVLGFEDPSFTGLTAAAMAFMPFTATPDLKVCLDFTRPVFEGWVEAEGRGCLGSLVWALILALFSEPVRRIWGGQFKRWLAGIIRWRPGTPQL